MASQNLLDASASRMPGPSGTAPQVLIIPGMSPPLDQLIEIVRGLCLGDGRYLASLGDRMIAIDVADGVPTPGQYFKLPERIDIERIEERSSMAEKVFGMAKGISPVARFTVFEEHGRDFTVLPLDGDGVIPFSPSGRATVLALSEVRSFHAGTNIFDIGASTPFESVCYSQTTSPSGRFFHSGDSRATWMERSWMLHTMSIARGDSEMALAATAYGQPFAKERYGDVYVFIIDYQSMVAYIVPFIFPEKECQMLSLGVLDPTGEAIRFSPILTSFATGKYCQDPRLVQKVQNNVSSMLRR